MYQRYDLSRYFEGDLSYASTVSVSDDDAVNCAHVLAAGFNTMSRNMLGDFVLGVVDTKAGTVQYDGQVKQIGDKPTYKPENSAGASASSPKMSPALLKANAGTLARSVLEDAFAELNDVREVLADEGVETIPAGAGVRTLISMNQRQSAMLDQDRVEYAELHKRNVSEHDVRLAMERTHREQNAAARAEMVELVRAAYTKWSRAEPGRERNLQHSYLCGMIKVLSAFLVATGEAEDDDRYSPVARACDIPVGTYMYDRVE